MQMILNDDEAREYLRLKSVFNADAKLTSFVNQIDYFYNVYLVPVHEREDLENYPEVPEAAEDDLKWRTKCLMEALLKWTAEFREELKAIPSNNKQ